MSKVIQCFFLTPVDKAQVVLRRFRWKDGDPEAICTSGEHKFGIHHAEYVGEVVPYNPSDPERGGEDFEHPRTDPNWPVNCSCGYQFKPSDQWQPRLDRLHRRSDTGELVTVRRAPPGAMWFADWYGCKGPDGHTLVVRTPAGDWVVDAPSSNGPGWKREGVPPDVTATPSIGMGRDAQGRWKYHGWLRNGQLLEC